jgi:RES domain-containing protein
MVLVAYDVPELSTRRAQSTESLPADWAEYPIPASTQDFGAAWAASRSELVMTVPSAVVPVETNWLINPAHADIATVTATLLGRYPFDSRLSG